MKNTLLSLIAIALLVCISFTDATSQRCKNMLTNPTATSGIRGWNKHQNAGVGNQRFTVKTSGSHLSQDVKIPSGSNTAYFGGWTRNSKKTTTGHGYLYGYIMDANDKILEYVQLGVQNETTTWKYQEKSVRLQNGATKVRFFLMKSAKRGVTDGGNVPRFDNLVLSFNCTKKTPNPAKKACRNLLKNHNASQVKQHWTFHSQGAGSGQIDGQRAFFVQDNSSHIYQDVAVPNGSRYAYLGGWTKNTKIATTGQAYLYGYVMDGGNKILEYIQFGVVNKTTAWGYQDKTVTLTNAAKKIRFFLKRSNINGETDVKNEAHFDNLTVSFDCKKKTNKPRSAGKACRNHIKNAQAKQNQHFTAYKDAEIKNGVFTVKTAASHLFQDVKIPAKSRYVYLAGYTKNLRPVKTGHAYLYAYIMDANDKIIEYVQFGTPNAATKWKLTEKRVKLTKAAKKVRFFMKKSAKKDVPDSKNYAQFDNLRVSFNCVKRPNAPK